MLCSLVADLHSCLDNINRGVAKDATSASDHTADTSTDDTDVFAGVTTLGSASAHSHKYHLTLPESVT